MRRARERRAEHDELRWHGAPGRLPPRAARKNFVAGAIGNLLEWYDFAVYGYFAPIIGALFFPADDPFTSLLAAFGVFAAGYAARPLGGAALGHIADTIGRKPALILSVTTMGVATFAIGLLPDHAQIGVTAALLLVVLRIVQGLSVGGEYTGSVVFVAEQAPPERRGYIASWPGFTSIAGFLLGSAIAALIHHLLSDEALRAWGWRVPFLIGAVIAVCGVVFRWQMTEPPAPEGGKRLASSPVVVALRDYWRPILRMICLILINGVGFYMIFVYAASYLTERMQVPAARALDINTLCLLLMLPLTPLSAALSDRIGRKPLLYAVAVGSFVLAWPLWWLMHHQSFGLILTGQIGFAVLFSIGFAVTSAVMVELLPAEVRCSGVAIGYNVCAGTFGGSTPLIATYLVERTADDFAPAYYLMATAALSFLALRHLPETARIPLSELAAAIPVERG